MKFGSNIVSWVVVLMAACSLLSMIGTLEIDGIINHDLYKYGLQFNYAWATPYWTLAGFVFAMGWFNIVTAMAVHLHALSLRRKASRRVGGQTEKETTQTITVEKLEEEKPKPAEAQEQPIDMQGSVIETNVQERKEETQAAAEDTTDLGQTQAGQSGQVEEQRVQKPEPSEETATEQEDSRTETWEIIEEEQDEDEQASEQEGSESEQSEETAEQENEEPQSPVESTTQQEETEQEQPGESEETPILERSSEP